MRANFCIPIALVVAASLSCGTSRPNADNAELAATSEQALSLRDDSDGKGVIAIDLSRLDCGNCNAAAQASAAAQSGDGQALLLLPPPPPPPP